MRQEVILYSGSKPFQSYLSSYPLDCSCPPPVFPSSNHPGNSLFSRLNMHFHISDPLEFSLVGRLSLWAPAHWIICQKKKKPLLFVDVESSIPTHVVQHPGQNVLPFPLCFYSPLFITLSSLQNPPAAFLFIEITFHLFNILLTHSRKTYWVLLHSRCWYVAVTTKKSPLSSHGAWTLIMSKFWVPRVSASFSRTPNIRSFLCRPSTKLCASCSPFPQVTVALQLTKPC